MLKEIVVIYSRHYPIICLKGLRATSKDLRIVGDVCCVNLLGTALNMNIHSVVW
jgi:hypothetical protein